MSEPFVIVDPGGTEHEFPGEVDPARAAAKVKEEYIASAGAKTQAALEAQSNPLTQYSVKNIGHDLAQGARGAWTAAKAIGGAVLRDPLGMGGDLISPEQREQMRTAAANAPSLGDRYEQAKGFLRTLPSPAQATSSLSNFANYPIDVAQAAGLTPDAAAQGLGTVTMLAAAPVLTHKIAGVSPAGVKAAAGVIASDIPVVRKWGPAVRAYGKAAAGEVEAAPAAAGVLKTAKVPPTPAEQMGMGGPPTGTAAMMDTFPDRPAPERARAPIPVEPAAVAAAREEATSAAHAAREAQSADLGVSPTSTGATLETLPETPVPDGRVPGGEPVQRAAEAADAAERHQALLKELGLGTPPAGDVEAPSPAAVSGEGRERISVPVKSEPPAPPPTPPSNTLMKAPTLQEILNDVRQQSTDPTRVTAPADAAPAGAGRQAFGTTSGTPAVTPERYQEIQATIPADAPRTADLDRAAVEAQRAAAQDAADAKAAAQQSSQSMPFDPANPETLGPPVHSGEILSDAVKQEIRQIAAEMDNLKFAKARGQFGGVGGAEGPSGGTAGAPVYQDIVGSGGYGSRGDVSREIDRVLDGTGGPNANTRAIIQTAKERVASQARPVVADQSYRTAAEREAQYYQDLTAREAAVKETPGSTGSTATPASGPGLREQLLEALQQRAKEQGIPLDTEALTHAMNDPDAFLGEIAQRYAPQEGDVSFDEPVAGASVTQKPTAAASYRGEVVHVTTPEAKAAILRSGFDPNKGGGLGGDTYGPGVYVADRPSDMGGFWRSQLETKNATGTVDTASLVGQADLQHAFTYEPSRYSRSGQTIGSISPRESLVQQRPDLIPAFDEAVSRGVSPRQAMGETLRNAGFDGIVVEHRAGQEVIAFDPGRVAWNEAGTATTPAPAAEGEGTIPSREQMRPDELSRAREGARDSPDRQPGETVEDYRLRTRGRVTGEQSTEPSIIPARRSSGIDDTIESMYARNATDQEFRDYLAKSKNHPNNGQIAAKIESKAHSWKRASPLAHVLVGAAAGGAALRQALVGQLQGDQKEQE